MKLDQFAQFRFNSLTEEEGWNRIEDYIQYQDDLWDDMLPFMNVSSILKAMQPTFRGRLERACNQISYLETPTREVGLKNPYLIYDYYGGSHEANECRQNNPAEQVYLSGGDIYDEPSLLRVKKQKKDDEDERLLSIFKHIHINLSFLESMIHMPKGAKVLKDLLSHKEKLEKATSSVKLGEECSAIIQRSLPQKEGDPGSFTLPCLIGPLAVKNALADLGASINLMSHSLFRRLGISKLKPTRMSIQLADRSIKYPIGVCENLLVKLSKFIFPVDFVVLEMDEDELVPIILGRPFLATARAVIDVHEGKVGRATRVEGLGESVETLKHRTTQTRAEGITQTPGVCFPPRKQPTPSGHLLRIIYRQESQASQILNNHKGAISWSITDIKGIDSSFCTLKILMEDEFKPSVQPQRRANSNIKEVVPKKGGMTVVKNEKNELIPQRTVTGWRVCIDYRKLNNATWKDHFPLPFIDQMLERLAGHEYYCFLDGFSGYFHIPIITPKDQEKTTFTCPYGTFTYKRMPFGLCNAPATFQRCMTAIFHELIEDSMEVFMDDFSVFGSSFDHCLKNLEKMLKRYEETNLVLNWEKCHFMVKEGIVLGHKVSGAGIKVDKAKIKAISKLPYPTNRKKHIRKLF
ncbi:DNA-directed DNA polymerase [Tanacetum coccineum]|uniref:DNA-directed DNA polymerase n=1 Tax=Tanacetum coccineum TaxID=301880 RepID=A0ABQ5E1D9_9ASTR